jgi:hypothetical protein
MSDYIPDRDADALLWMNAFSSGISADPAKFELSEADAEAISQAVSEYQEALAVATNKATRTEETVNVKDTKRNAAKTLCRHYAIDIKFNSGISDAEKIAIGVRPVNTDRSPVFCPQTSPILSIIAATPGAHTLRYSDSFTPDSAKRPFGAAALQIFAYIGDEITDNENLAHLIDTATRNPVVAVFQPEDDGKMITYFGRWIGRRGDTGPWSLGVSMRIAA